MTTSVDDLFKKPSGGVKRKLEPVQDPNVSYKTAKTSTTNFKPANIEDAVNENDNDDDQDDVEAGPELPDDEGGRFYGGGVTEETLEVLDYIDGKEDQAVKIDLSWLRRTAIGFEKKINKNAELRAKFDNTPAKFMASEADLDASIKELSLLSDHPEHFEEFVRLGCVKSLVDLLAHENTDIAIDALEVIAEFTDDDVAEGWDIVVDALLEADLLSLVSQVLQRFDEASESDQTGVFHALSVLEHLASRTSLSEELIQLFAPWLLNRVQGKTGQNQQYSMEILAILSQNTRKLADFDAEELFLQILNQETGDDEFLENVWACLSSIAGPKFLEAEGVELCLKLLREGNKRALGLLNHTPDVSQKIIAAAGLKILFGILMKKHNGSGRDYEHLLGIFLNMLQELPEDSASRIRLLAKFVEKSYQKALKLVELRPVNDDSTASVMTDMILESLAQADNGLRKVLEAEE